MAMPPIFTLEPGKTQLIRIALRTAKSQIQELTYRIFITEVPDMTERVVEGIRTNLRISVPVFVQPKVRAKPELEWILQRISETDLRLVIKNTGTAHILLGTLKLFFGKEVQNPFHEKTLSGYVLSGQSGHGHYR
jgi:fimbrial chaperone protein